MLAHARKMNPVRLATGALLALGCASSRLEKPVVAPPEQQPRCEVLRDLAIRECVNGFIAVGGEDALEMALHEVCPYAGALAWSGCRRGALEQFKGRSGRGSCDDLADYIESSIETSCVHHAGTPLDRWSGFLKACFEWALRGGEDYRSGCEGNPGAQSL